MYKDPIRTLVHQSLVKPMMIGGVERRLVIVNGAVTASMMLGWRIWWFLGVGLVAHLLAMWLTAKLGPQFVLVIVRNGRHKWLYEP